MNNQNRIALFVDIDNMPLNKQHVDNIINQLEKHGEVVCAKIYGVTDRRHREIICDAVARGFETVPPVYPTRRGSTKVFDIRILVDLCELVATNKTIDAVAIVANPAHQVYLFSKLKRNGIKIFACDNLDSDSAKFVDEVLSFGYDDPNSMSKPKKQKAKAESQPVEEKTETSVEQIAEEKVEQPVVEEKPVEVVEQEQIEVEKPDQQEVEAEQEIAEEEEQSADIEPVEEETVVEQVEEVAEKPVEEQPQIIEEIDAVVEEDEEQEDDQLDILRQIQDIKDDVPSSDDEEDEALIAKIKQLLDEFN